MQSMSSYQTMAPQRTITRYYPLAYTKKKLGIDYCDTDEFLKFGTSTNSTYGG